MILRVCEGEQDRTRDFRDDACGESAAPQGEKAVDPF
jgi:hypothetical protein